jgi:hypothetical protein
MNISIDEVKDSATGKIHDSFIRGVCYSPSVR